VPTSVYKSLGTTFAWRDNCIIGLTLSRLYVYLTVHRGEHDMTDNIAILDGYTAEWIGEADDITLYILIKPGTDFDSTFTAWDTDNQEYIRINGWLFCFEPVE
jgi:hypothetical protein